MTNNSRRRGRKKGKLARSIRRSIRNILLMPGKIPPITAQTVEVTMKACEVFGVLFVGTLIANLISENLVISYANIVLGIIFVGLMAFIKLAGYQDRLIREQLSNYIYIR